MTFRRCRHRSDEWRRLRRDGWITLAVSNVGIALLMRIDE